MSTDVLVLFQFSQPAGTAARLSDTFSQIRWWGGWGSNPRPADYESAALTG
jgi:hypothetical protein